LLYGGVKMIPFIWPFVNAAFLVILIIVVLTYLIRKEDSYRKEMTEKIDSIILLLQNRES